MSSHVNSDYKSGKRGIAVREKMSARKIFLFEKFLTACRAFVIDCLSLED